VRRTRSGSDLIAQNERRVPFWVQDATGRLLVIPAGARVELEQTVDRFEAGHAGGVERFWPWQPSPGSGQRRTLGHRLREEVLPLGRTVYILGTATDRTGSLVIGALPESHEPFLVSLHTREQLLQTAQQTMVLARAAAVVCAPLGVLLLLIGILSRR
jgi:hypothetical protein